MSRTLQYATTPSVTCGGPSKVWSCLHTYLTYAPIPPLNSSNPTVYSYNTNCPKANCKDGCLTRRLCNISGKYTIETRVKKCCTTSAW